MPRYERIDACVHGEWNVHALEPGVLTEDGIDREKVCPGGVRRELVIDYDAAKRAYEDAPVPIRAEDFVRRIVDAALGDPDA